MHRNPERLTKQPGKPMREKMALRQLKLTGNPLTEQQELVLHLREKEGLIYQQIVERTGLPIHEVRELYRTAKIVREDYAQNGINEVSLLPTRARIGLYYLELSSRSQVKAAIQAGELVWCTKRKVILHKGKSRRALGVETWLALQEWVSDDWGR